MSNGQTDRIQQLMELGFEEAGRWSSTDQALVASLDRHTDACPVLYAFSTGTELLYLGKSTRPLGKRLCQYENPGCDQRTNLRVQAKLRERLRRGEEIRIVALAQWEPIVYRGIPVNLPAGLEDELIARFGPTWNKTGHRA